MLGHGRIRVRDLPSIDNRDADIGFPDVDLSNLLIGELVGDCPLHVGLDLTARHVRPRTHIARRAVLFLLSRDRRQRDDDRRNTYQCSSHGILLMSERLPSLRNSVCPSPRATGVPRDTTELSSTPPISSRPNRTVLAAP